MGIGVSVLSLIFVNIYVREKLASSRYLQLVT